MRDVFDEKSVSAEVPKYQRSALDDESSKLLLEELQEIVVTSRPYLDSKLTLSQPAIQLNISSSYLSQVINQQTGSNFFDYINGHRMQAAKEILADPARSISNVLTIGMDFGFNSKSAFYSAFRRHALMTSIQCWQCKVSKLTRLDYKAENLPDNRLQADSSNLSGARQNETHIWTVGPGPDGLDPNFR